MHVVVLLDPSISLGKIRTESQSKYLRDKVNSNREIGNGKVCAISLFLAFGFGGQSDRKCNIRRELNFLEEQDGTI